VVEYHEKWDALSPDVRDLHRAIKSLQEELEAVDWYNQRVALTDDEGLRQILEHNRDEEIEHAAMIIEWLRRNMDGWDAELRTYMFTEAPVVEVEENSPTGGASLGIGKPKGGE
jgi:ferritin-like protein